MKVFIVTGEASGDRLGAALVGGLKQSIPDILIQGVAGPEMKALGVPSLFEMSELSVMGVSEIFPKYLHLKNRLAQTVQAVLTFKPQVLVTIDSPDFCLRVARAVRAADPNIRTVHYVAPTVWAWRPTRARKMAKFIDHVLALFPFEPPYMEAEGMACDFVGHPISSLKEISAAELEAFRSEYGIDPNKKSLLVLPGSRKSEISRLIPCFNKVLRHKAFADIQLIFPTLPHIHDLLVEKTSSIEQSKFIFSGNGKSQLNAARQRFIAYSCADAALAASGTVSLELAAVSTPMVIAYDMGLLSRLIIGAMLRVDSVTLVNLVSDTRDIPEFIGKRCKSQLIIPALEKVLRVPGLQAEAMSITMNLLGRGEPGQGTRAADAILARL